MMVAQGKNGIQRRKPRHDGWTVARRALFLDTLAITCHVAHSAAAAGADPSSARRLRRRDPAFGLLWAAAMAAGQERLREELLAHSLGQLASGDNPGTERAERDVGPFDAEGARRTLKTLAALDRTDGGRRGDRPDYATDAEVTVLLADRLDALAKRLARA